MSHRRPLVAVTAIPRLIKTTLPEVTANATVDHRFGELVAAAGGMPVMVDHTADPEELADRVDAIVISGGTDVDPDRYGSVPHPSVDAPDVRRDDFEFALAGAALERGIPILGICRGMHVLNVLLGGTLLQHLPDTTDLPHSVYRPFDSPVHHIEVEPGSALHEAFGSRADVNSLHHQAVDRLAPSLRATAHAPDWTIEAVEDESRAVLGVQWHPELFAPEHLPGQVPLFRALLATGRASDGATPVGRRA